MPNILSILDNIIYFVRDQIWKIPDTIFFGPSSLTKYFYGIYTALAPFSYFALAFIILTAPVLAVYNGNLRFHSNSSVLKEAVVMGVDDFGNVIKLSNVNPIIPSNIQLEKDIAELVYEPLIRYDLITDEDGYTSPSVNPILAESVFKIKEGSDYQFRLRKNVLWHDGVIFSADDVIRTLEIYSSLNISNAYVQTIKQLTWDKIDDYNVRICTKSLSGEDHPCGKTINAPILSNFLELISIKILPAHLTGDINFQNVNTAEPKLFVSPVGTGPYKFDSADNRGVVLTFNSYHTNKLGIEVNPDIKRIEFLYFEDTNSAINALKNGSVHTFVTSSVEYLKDLERFNNIEVGQSDVVSNQYWALYFNLRVDPNGKSIAPHYIQDVNIRKAISLGIDRNRLISEALLGLGEEALSTIYYDSYFFDPIALWTYNNPEEAKNALKSGNWSYDPKLTPEQNFDNAEKILKEKGVIANGFERYNIPLANELLETSGWKIRPGDKIRSNDNGEYLTFSLYFADSFDRGNVAESLKIMMEEIGIELVINRREQPGQNSSTVAPTGWSLTELNDQILAPRLFDIVLYGMNTFNDPDRYELFHSSQQTHPGLNIAGYTGTEKTVKPRENRQEGESSLVEVSKVDRLLEQTRGFDPVAAKNERKVNYDIVQELIRDDAPVVFLYHPKFLYYYNNELEDVNLTSVTNTEHRFKNILDWKL